MKKAYDTLRTTRRSTLRFIFILITSFHSASHSLEACTTAIVSPAASRDNMPMLWKNRDTDVLSNKVVYVEAVPFSYVGLTDAGTSSGRYVYAGLNSQGFGIMNTVAYNLPSKSGEKKDLEGLIMADALRTCRGVDDFERYIKANLGTDLGSWANFGVIDASGNAVLFEVHNHGCRKYDAASSPEGYLINSNFSRSGEEGKGAGYLRFERATHLFSQIPSKKITAQHIIELIARDFGHPLVAHPTLDLIEKTSSSEPLWISVRDTLNRPSTASAVVICGRKQNAPPNASNLAAFWVVLGEPVTSIAVPVWVESKAAPAPLCLGDNAPLYLESTRIRSLVHPHTESDKENYLLATRLVNKENTGYLPIIRKTEAKIFQETQRFLDSQPQFSAIDLAAFQEKMAQEALQALKEIK